MTARFRSGSVTPCRPRRNSAAASTTMRSRFWLLCSASPHLVHFARAQQAGVDQDAREPVADGGVRQRGGDGAVDAAAEPANHAGVGRMAADVRNGLAHEGRRGPVTAAAADVARRNCAADPAHATYAGPRGGTAARSLRCRWTWPPWASGRLRRPSESRAEALRPRRRGSIHTSNADGRPAKRGCAPSATRTPRRAVLAPRGRLHAAAQAVAQQLHAVADAQDRDARVQHVRRKLGGRPARRRWPDRRRARCRAGCGGRPCAVGQGPKARCGRRLRRIRRAMS